MRPDEQLRSERVMRYLVTLDIPNTPEGRIHDLRIARDLIQQEIERIERDELRKR